jgi:hypothetical protein
MAIVRKPLEEAKAMKPEVDWAKVKATTEENMLAVLDRLPRGCVHRPDALVRRSCEIRPSLCSIWKTQ